jgi:hypothetical protein
VSVSNSICWVKVFSLERIVDNLAAVDELKRSGRPRGRHLLSYSSQTPLQIKALTFLGPANACWHYEVAAGWHDHALAGFPDGAQGAAIKVAIAQTVIRTCLRR